MVRRPRTVLYYVLGHFPNRTTAQEKCDGHPRVGGPLVLILGTSYVTILRVILSWDPLNEHLTPRHFLLKYLSNLHTR